MKTNSKGYTTLNTSVNTWHLFNLVGSIKKEDLKMMNTNHLNPADEEEDRPYPSFTTFNVLNYIYSATLLISLGLIIGLFVRFYVIDTDILGLAYHYLFMTAIIFGFIWDTVNGVMGWIIVTSEKKLAPLVMFGTAAAVRLCCGIVLYDPGYFIYALIWIMILFCFSFLILSPYQS